MKELAFLVLITAIVTNAQMPASPESKSDAEKITSALQAGPKFVTQNATVLDYPTSPSSEFRVFLEPPTMNPAALTKSSCSSSRTVWPVARPM
jgi:hypothetical protein